MGDLVDSVEEIQRVFYEAIDDINGQRDITDQLHKSSDLVVFGDLSTFDSLAVINFITTVEQKLALQGLQAPDLLQLITEFDETADDMTLGYLVDAVVGGQS